MARVPGFALAISVVFVVGLPSVLHAVPPNNSEAVIDCARWASGIYLCDAIDACNRNHKLPRWRMDVAHRCARALLKCDLLERIDPIHPSLQSCRDTADRRCARLRHRQNRFLNRRHLLRKANFYDFCGAVDPDIEFFETPFGLGYQNDLQTCASLGVPINEVNDYPECGDTYTTRLHAQLLGLIEPRARDLLEDTNQCDLFPEERSDPVVCNVGFPPRPALSEEPPVGGWREIRGCQDRFFKHGRRIHASQLDILEHCSEDYQECNLKQVHEDISQNGYDQCLADAYDHCGRLRDTAARLSGRAAERIKKNCGKISWEDITGKLGFSDIAASCNVTNVNDLVDCAVDRMKCLAWDVTRFVEPRLLDDMPPEFIADYLSLCGS